MIVEVKNLQKKFGDLTAVNNVNFSLEKGDIFAFLGPNGAGKSTTIKMLTTLLKPNLGEINLCGINALTQKDEVRKHFGIVFQDPSLDDDLTAYENLEFHGALYGIKKQERKPKIKELLTFVELWDRRNDLVKKFSGGMKRRLEIARGLMHKPDIFFLDEPTIGLDPQTRNHIWEYIKNLNQKEGITIFFTTHYMEEAEKVSNKICVIDHGTIIAQGNAEQLKSQTQTASLEDAFIKLTGRNIRDESSSNLEKMRMRRRAHGH